MTKKKEQVTKVTEKKTAKKETKKPAKKDTTPKVIEEKVEEVVKPQIVDNGSGKKYVELINEVYRAFDFFNARFAEGKLIRPVIMIASAHGKNALGWFGNKFWKDADGEASEINLSAEYLSRGYADVLETLLHEMAHLKNAQEGLHDCSPNQYHNKQFKVAAELFGLSVVKAGYTGYSRTALADAGKQAIEDLKPNKELFGIFKKSHRKMSDDRYIPLIVNRSESMEEMLETIAEHYESKKEAVTDAITQLYNKLNKK